MTKDEISEFLQKEADAILHIPLGDHFYEAIDLIYEHVHQRDGKLIASGMGKAGQIAINMATTFSSCGTPAVFLHPGDAQHGDLGVIQKNDVMLLVSNSGKTNEILELIDLAKNIHPAIPFIVITGNENSPLAEMANVTILTGGPEEICPLGMTPTTSTTTMTVIGDIMVSMLIKKTAFTAEEYAKRHHGGYLGHKSRNRTKKD